MVILAYLGTEDFLKRVWDKMLPGIEKKVITVEDPDTPIVEYIPELLTDEEVAEQFILVPAAVIPCAKVCFEELFLPVVYLDGKGGRHYDRLPMAFDKDELVTLLGADDFKPENFIKKYTEGRGRAVEVSFKEGNFVTPVLRGNPCEHVVMEALVRKKYLIASAQGLAAITPLLQNTLLK